MRKIIIGLLMLNSVLLMAQTSLTPAEIVELKQMYRENYEEWVSSKDIERLVEESPYIDSIINTVNIQETLAFQEIKKKLKNGKMKPVRYDLVFNKGMSSVVMGYVKELLDPENTQIITNLYWDIINSSEGREIGEIVVKQMEKAIFDISKEAKNFKPPN